MTPEAVLELARAHNMQIATAESCTGGMIAAALTDIAGSSDVFERGFVTYSNAAKTQMLGVAPELITTHGAVSEEVAQAMAMGALARDRGIWGHRARSCTQSRRRACADTPCTGHFANCLNNGQLIYFSASILTT